MYKKTIEYVDYEGLKRKEDFYFHFTEAEIMEMQHEVDGGLSNYIAKIINTQDSGKLIKIFKELLLKSYGEKSNDGRRFIKSDELSTAFSHTEAYSMFFMELATDAEEASRFVNNILPANMIAEASNITQESIAEQLGAGDSSVNLLGSN